MSIAVAVASPAASSADAQPAAPKARYARKDAERPGTYWYAPTASGDGAELLAVAFVGRDAHGRHVFRPLWLGGLLYRCAVPCRSIELYQPDVDLVRRTFPPDPNVFHAHLFEDAERGLLEPEGSAARPAGRRP